MDYDSVCPSGRGGLRTKGTAIYSGLKKSNTCSRGGCVHAGLEAKPGWSEVLFLSPPLKIATISAKSPSTVSWDGKSILRTLAWQVLSKSNNVQICPFLSFDFPLTSFFFFGFLSLISNKKLYFLLLSKNQSPLREGPSEGESS